MELQGPCNPLMGVRFFLPAPVLPVNDNQDVKSLLGLAIVIILKNYPVPSATVMLDSANPTITDLKSRCGALVSERWLSQKHT